MPAPWLQRIEAWRNNDSLRETLLEGVLSFFIVLLPFQWKFPPISLMMMLLGVVFLLYFNPSKYWKRLRSARWFWPLAAFYAWILIGLSYTDYPAEGAADVQVQIALIAWPLGITALGGLSRAARNRLFTLFTRALAISIILLLILALQQYVIDQNIEHFFYKNLAAWELVPQHYLSMYLSFATLALIYRWFTRRSQMMTWQKAETFILVALFLGAQSLLSVRIQFIAMPLAFIPVLIAAVRMKSIGKKGWIIGGSVAAVVVTILFLLPGSQRRIMETYHELRSINKVVDKKQTNHRVYLWRYGTDVIAENPIWGTGTGGANKALHEKLLDCDAKFWDGTTHYYLYEKEYNVHNVFMQSWMAYGLIGFALILIITVGPLIAFWKAGDYLTVGFLLLCIISFMTESMLERQAGVLWFAAFYSLLVVAPKKEADNA